MLIKQALVWESFYQQAIQRPKEIDALLPGLYCLFISLEMRLKAYIILLDKTYSSPAKLRRMGHNFSDIYEVIHIVAPSNMSREVMECLKAYNLFNSNVNDLRYPETPRTIQIDRNLEKGDHRFISLFETIDAEVQERMDEWLLQSS